jgi:DNA polymerase-3 subunit alpha
VPARAPAFDHVFVIYPSHKIEPEQLRDNEYIGLRASQLNQFGRQTHYKSHQHKFVIHHPITFADRIGFNTHRLLRAIDNNTLLSKLSPHHQAHEDEIMVPEQELEKNSATILRSFRIQK